MASRSLIWLRRLTKFALLILVLSGVWAGVYASSKGLTKKWRGMVQEEFARHGITLSLRKLTLDPFHGLVAKEVKLYNRNNEEYLIASIDRLELDVSLVALARDELFLNHLEVTDAEVVFPLTDKGTKPRSEEEKLVISNFNGRIHLDERRIKIDQTQGTILGVEFLINIELLHRDLDNDGLPDIAMSHEKEDSTERSNENRHQWNKSLVGAVDQIRAATEILREMEFATAPAKLNIKGSAELHALESADLTVDFSAPLVLWRGREFTSVIANAHYKEGVLDMRRYSFADDSGTLDGELEFVRETKRLRFAVRSETRALNWLTAILPELAESGIELADSPLIELSGELDMNQQMSLYNVPGKLEGLMASGSLSYRGVPFDYVSLQFAAEGKQTFFKEIKVRHATGLIEGDFLRSDEEFRAKAIVSAHPEKLSCFAFGAPDVVTFLGRFGCDDSSQIAAQLSGEGRFDDTRTWVLRGDGSFDNITFNRIAVRKGSTTWQMRDHMHTMGTTRVEFKDGGAVVAKSIVHDSSKGLTTVDSLKGKAYPETVLSLVAPETGSILSPYRFSSPPDVKFNGDVAENLGRANNFQATITSSNTMTFPFCGSDLPVEQANIELLMLGNVLHLPAFSGSLMNGLIKGELTSDFGDNMTGVTGAIQVRNVDFSPLVEVYRETSADTAPTDEGQITGHIDFNYIAGDTKSLEGKGVAAILNGNIFSLPLFGPLSPLVEAVLPNAGVGYSVAKEATANFSISDGIVETNDFVALTPAFAMKLKGTVNCVTNNIDLNARLNARGVAQVTTFLLSYIFEFKGSGSIDDPEWESLHFGGN